MRLEVGEGFVIGGVDDEQIGNFEFEGIVWVDYGSFLVNSFDGEVCCIDLLGNIISRLV